MAIADLTESFAVVDDATAALLNDHRPASSPARSVAKGALAMFSTQPLTWATSLLVVTFLPRLLGAVALGQFALAFTLPNLLGPAVSLGLLEYLSRRLASRSPAVAAEASLAWVIMTVVSLIAASVLAIVVSLTGLQVGGPVVLFAALGTLILTPSAGLLLTLLRGQERMARFAATSSITAAAGALIPMLVLVAGGGLELFALTTFLVTVVACVVGWRMAGIRLPRVHITLKGLITLLPAGLPFFGWTLTMQFYGQIDRILLGMLAPVDVVGWYAAAIRIIGIPIFVPMLIVTPLFPALTRCRDDRPVFRKTLNASLRATLLATAPFCAAIAATAPAIPDFLGWPADFAAATVPMTILAPNLALIAMDMTLGTALLALGLERKWLIVGLVAAVVNPTLNLIAIPMAQATWGNGGIAAAAVVVITEFVMLCGALVLMPRGILDRALLSQAARMALGGGLFVFVTRQLVGVELPLLIALGIGGLAFVMCCFALRVVHVSDLRQARHFAFDLVRSKTQRAQGTL
jgi:O-antigen/teichoic acid export membrane protein